MSDNINVEELVQQIKDELLQTIRDEISMFVLKGPGWFNNHDPFEYHRCQRCNTMIPMGQGCPCDVLGNTKIITLEEA